MSFKFKQKGLPVVYFPKLGKFLRLTMKSSDHIKI